MVLRRLLFTLLNNAQMIDRLAESRPIRRAAQLTAFAITKAQLGGRDALRRLLGSDTVQQLRREARAPGDAAELGRRASRIRETFVKEVKQGMKEVSEKVKNK